MFFWYVSGVAQRQYQRSRLRESFKNSGWLQMGAAGHPILETPTMDQLAAEGVRFTNAFVTTSICAASRATILTGLYERSHRFTFGTPPLTRELTDRGYAAVLRDAGYRTGFVGKIGVRFEPGAVEKMFDYYETLDRDPYFREQPDGTTRHISQIADDKAIEFLRSLDDKPFSLSISFNAPHAEDNDKEDHYPWPRVMDGTYDDVSVPAPRLSEPSVFENCNSTLGRSANGETLRFPHGNGCGCGRVGSRYSSRRHRYGARRDRGGDRPGPRPGHFRELLTLSRRGPL